MAGEFRLLMVSAMYENGGNVTHRHLDGHPDLFVYPFESQLGTRYVRDMLSGMFPEKYRWPEFLVGAGTAEVFTSIIDEELKVRARTPHVSKFRHAAFELDDERRKALFTEELSGTTPTRADYVKAFFAATRRAWENCRASVQPRAYVGYSPAIIVDAEKIVRDFPTAVILHVVRNPWAAYADTKKRPVPLSLANYCTAWCLNQYFALLFRRKYPQNVFIVRYEDLLSDQAAALAPVLNALGLPFAEQLRHPSFNGEPLAEVNPWGTIRKVTAERNRATAMELGADEQRNVTERTSQYLSEFDYTDFLAAG